MDSQQIGSWAFILGVVIAIIGGIAHAAAASVPGAEFVPLILIVLGLVVGFLNISDKEITDFLIASIALLALAVSAAGLQNIFQTVEVGVIKLLADYIVRTLEHVAVFVAPVALVVALKTVNNLSKTPSPEVSIGLQKIGSLAFVLGVVLAIIAGIVQSVVVFVGVPLITFGLFVFGVIVGVLNITDREVNAFLLAAIALIALSLTAAGLNNIPFIGSLLVRIVGNIAVFVAPAALIVSLKAVNNLAKSPD